MLTALILAHAAHATEIGTVRKFGLGAEVGNGTYISVAAQYWLTEKSGISFHAGTSFGYHEVGARYESTFYTGEWFSWADLPIWWWAGADAGGFTGYGIFAPQLGVSGGAGAALQFANFPGEAYFTAGAGVFPVNYCSSIGLGGLCWIQGRGTAGFRYYF